MAARKKKLTQSLPEAGHSRRCFCKTDGPFCFTSSPPLPLYSVFLLYFPFWFYKRNWHPESNKMFSGGSLVHQPLGLLAFQIKSYSLPQHLVSWLLACHGLSNTFRILSLSLCFDGLPMIYLGLDLFEFILLGIHCTSWRCGLMFFIKFGSFLAIISFSLPLSFLSFWDFAYAYVGMFYEVLKVS